MHGLVQIAPLPPVPLHDLFTYRVPEPLRPLVRPGMRVRMPLGRQTRTGVVAGFVDVAPPGELRPILDVLDADPFVPPDLLELCRWTAGYYLASLAEVLAAVVPAAIASRDAASFLLHGVTGSGKTEVFLAAAEHTLAAGRDVLLLVPEIALTHQLVDRVRARFGDALAVLHSGLGPRERWDEWRRVRHGGARLVVGARSAVFAPLPRLGLVVVDEEHDPAYKQEDGLRYNARDVGIVRARLARAVVVLASATPSAESYQAARDGRHVLLELPDRPTAHPLPPIELVRLRGRPPGLLTDELSAALAANLARGEQTLVFLNRRGFAAYLQCPACGVAATCPHCSVTLTWHRAARALVCHHCHHRRRPPPTCPACGGPPLAAFGVGTEQIEAALRAVHPLATVERLDR